MRETIDQNKLFNERKRRACAIAKALHTLYGHDRGTALAFTTPWELLVAVVLSAQSRDVLVNEITPNIFKKYPTVYDVAKADLQEFDDLVKKINYHTTKSKNIIASAKYIVENYGEVPRDIGELMKLPGVGRKTANVITSNAFKEVYGIAVDTHVRRLSLKFDLTDKLKPNDIEQDLMMLLPRSEWFDFHNNLIYYGREICPARKHECAEHFLTKIWPSAASRWPRAQ